MLRRFGWVGLAALLAAGATISLPRTGEAAAAKAPPDAGTWDLVFEKGNRRCRLFLRSEPHGDGFAIATTSACHKAFPMLAGATGWSVTEGSHVLFRSDAGQTVADFGPDITGSLATTLPDGETYQLTPISPAEQDRLRAAAAAPTADNPVPAALGKEAGEGVMVSRAPAGKPAAAEAVALPPTTANEVAGNYAVLRQDRDTGCMVSLLAGTGRGESRARLAPACRDQGIVVFDPAAWKLVGGSELVLTAKRGHSTVLKRKSESAWATAPARGAPLVLKRL